MLMSKLGKNCLKNLKASLISLYDAFMSNIFYVQLPNTYLQGSNKILRAIGYFLKKAPSQ